MKVIFLDFDGVLNSVAFFEWDSGRFDRLDPAAVARLNVIVERSGAKVVVSSSWRLKRSLAELRALLADLGFLGEVIDRTPELPRSAYGQMNPFEARSREIQAWLDASAEPLESFVILDDAILDDMAPNHVRTDFNAGLTDRHVAEAIDLLSQPSEPPRS